MSDINIVLENRDDIRVAVEEKDINVEVPAGKDGRSLHPQGEWSASVAYAYLDLVSYQGSSYVATKAVPAGTLPTDTSYWMLSAEKGEPGGAVWGNIAGDLSDQTDLQEALDDKAPVILSNASGSIASFSDGSASPVTALSVSIEPVQDLHGYDNPWPAGGGKNKLPSIDATQTISGVTWTLNADGSVKLSGTATANSVYDFGRDIVTLPAGTYTTLDITITGIYTVTIFKIVGGTASAIKSGGGSFTLSEETSVFVRYVVQSGVTVNTTIYPQIELGSSATSYAPYSNICPISGHTSAVVTRTGKNLLKVSADNEVNYNGKDLYTLVYSENNTVKMETSYTAALFVVYHILTVTPNMVGQTFVLSIDGLNNDYGNSRIIRTNNKDWDATGTKELTTNIRHYFTITQSEVGQKIGFRFYNNSGADLTISNVQVELGSVATSFEPYQGTSVTIDLNGTRYGGTLNVLTGEMTVTTISENFVWGNLATAEELAGYTRKRAILTANAESPYTTTQYCNMGKQLVSNTELSAHFYCLTNIGVIVMPNTLDASATVQLVYELATPITVQLTPEQLSTLLGTNNLWADTGDVAVEYRADTKLFVQGQIAQTAKVTRQMIADSATADGKAPKSLATGDLIIVGDELRKATANIGNGSAITASNSTTATLADVIKALQ